MNFSFNSRSLFILSLIGTGLKLGPVAFIDELALLIYGVFVKNFNFKLKVNIYFFLILYFFVICIYGFLIDYSNINTLRYLIFSFFLFLFCAPFKSISISSLKVTSYLFLVISLSLPLIGFYFNLETAWWQNWLWTGTTYAALGVFYSVSIILCLNKKISTDLLTLIIIFVISVASDSRIMILYLSFFTIVFFLKHKIFKRFFQGKLNIVFSITLILVILSTPFLLNNDTTRPVIKGSFKTFIDIIDPESDYDSERDLDRRIMNETINIRFGESSFKSLFGSGNLSHQREMLPYADKISKQYDYTKFTQDKIRPTGLPAVFFDGGMLLLFLIIISYFSLIINLMKYKYHEFYKLVIGLAIPTISVLNLLITNVTDMVFWWYAISPYGLSYLILTSDKANSYK
tara:strand:+ start:857 stop:2062 length:1206 start_codon:yes stop_codon:yes gene_type:complete